MVVQYNRQGDRLYPQKVLYGSNANIGLPMFASVDLTYEARPDIFSNYSSGFNRGLVWRLKGVDVKVGDAAAAAL
jgi:hypothetical protein